MSEFPLLAVELDKPGALQQGHPAGRESRRGRGSSVGWGRVGRIGRGIGVVPSGGGAVLWCDSRDRWGRIGVKERRCGRAGGEPEHEAAEGSVLHAFVGVGIWVGAGVGEGDGVLGGDGGLRDWKWGLRMEAWGIGDGLRGWVGGWSMFVLFLTIPTTSSTPYLFK